MRCSCGAETTSGTSCVRCGRPFPTTPWTRIALDASAGVGLLLALALVWALDRGAPRASARNAEGTQLQTTEVSDPADEDGPPREIRKLRLAVTPVDYDDMGKLLKQLGQGYTFETVQYKDLLSLKALSQYDVVFLTCSRAPNAWLGEQVRNINSGVLPLIDPKPEVVAGLRQGLGKFVREGGTLYASDWQYQMVRFAFEELSDDREIRLGAIGEVNARIVDSGLRKLLERDSIPLLFDKPAWLPAAFSPRRSASGSDVEMTVYLRGEYNAMNGARTESPLLVKIPIEKGSIIFTSFHNEHQNSEIETKLLKYLVFTTVTAREEARVKKTLVKGGFSPKERSLLSVSSQSPSVTQKYDCKKQGQLRFVLGFENQGAELKLSVVGPDGARQEKSATSTITLTFDDAAPGAWEYTITPIKVPYPDFPFTLTIGEK